MKVLMLNYEFPPIGGGAANACYYLLKEYSKQKIEVDLITSSVGDEVVEKFSKNIRIHRLDVKKKDVHYWRSVEIARWTVRAYRKAKDLGSYDLCHCWFSWPSGLIGYLLKGKMPYIVALRGSDVPGYNPRLKYMDRFLFSHLSRLVWKNSGAVIANSEGLRDLALSTYNTYIQIIPNGVDVQEFRPKKTVGKKLRLICVSRLVRRKGLGYLLQALAQVKDAELKLIGDGKLRDKLQDLSKRLRVQSRVRFMGVVAHDELAKHYQNSDVFVLPSLNEGMSNTVLEAMACGLPIIMTNTGGAKELLNGNGIIVRKKSVRSIVDALADIRDDAKVFGKKSVEIARTLSWGNVSKEYDEVYGKFAV